MIGAHWQRWIEDPLAPGCRVELQSQPLNLMALTTHPDETQRWSFGRNTFVPAPAGFDEQLQQLGLPVGPQAYRKIRINGPDLDERINAEPNEYVHLTARGVIFGMDLNRYNGPHWNEIALGQYALDFPLETLRYIYFNDVINHDTKTFIFDQIYGPLSELRFLDINNTQVENKMIWTHGTPEYQGIMGTTFGKMVAALMISAFPRGSFQIARIVTWKYADLQIRFDIEDTEYMQGFDL